ncbi:MAG TPA: heme biosynthesis HemY N-terminal domain-containing protein [Burkholderiales bacterium]|jgi:HemY protein|nr:heme biosynthesis HemY N-terminal domain-containing protein [Burkholderiales bacterium]
MKSLTWLVIVFAAAAALAVFGRTNEGYALLVYPPWRIEVSLLLGIVALVLTFALLYTVTRVVHRALELPAQVRAYRERRNRERSQGALAAALQAYLEGRFVRAEREAERAWGGDSARGLAALIGARAAHQLRQTERRDRWFERAASAGSEALSAARLISRAELALEDRDYATAREALARLHESGPRHIATLRMLIRAERGAGNWEEVLRLAGVLAKRDAIAPGIAEQYRVQAILELLALDAADRRALEDRWRRISAHDQVLPRVAAAAARHFTAHGNAALARETIERALDADWAPQLVALYGELPAGMSEPERSAEARARVERGERWLLERSTDAQLLATLGRLCAQVELWGKARNFLEASLSFEESRSAHLELARLAERLGPAADAQQHYRRAAEIS